MARPRAGDGWALLGSGASADSPSPYKGRGRRERGGRGYCGRGAQRSVIPPPYRHSCVGRNPFGRPSAHDGAQAPSPLIPKRLVIPAKAGTYPQSPLSLQGERTPRTRRERVLATGRVAFRHSPTLPSFLRRQESIRAPQCPRRGASPVSPNPQAPRHSRESGNLPHDRHSRLRGNPPAYAANSSSSVQRLRMMPAS